MKITQVEAIVIRQPAHDTKITDGSQDDLIIRVHTDAGIVGIGEVDSAPEVIKAIVEAPSSARLRSRIAATGSGSSGRQAGDQAGDQEL